MRERRCERYASDTREIRTILERYASDAREIRTTLERYASDSREARTRRGRCASDTRVIRTILERYCADDAGESTICEQWMQNARRYATNTRANQFGIRGRRSACRLSLAPDLSLVDDLFTCLVNKEGSYSKDITRKPVECNADSAFVASISSPKNAFNFGGRVGVTERPRCGWATG